MRDTVTIIYGDGRVFRAVITDLAVQQETRTMQTAAGHDYRVAVGLPRGSLEFMGLEEITPKSPPLPTKAESEDPNWGTWS